MPFSVATLKNAIKDAFEAAFAETEDKDAAFEALAQAIADNIGTQVKDCIDTSTINITYISGLVSPSGPVTGVFNDNTTITSQKT